MNSMDRINQLLELPKEEFNAEVHKKPFSFFKDLKALPDDKANIVYEAFSGHWKQLSENIEQTMDMVDSIAGKFARDYDMIDDMEPLWELISKISMSFEIQEDHEDKRIPIGHRLVIEATLLEAVNHTVDMVKLKCRDFDALYSEPESVNVQISELRAESHRLAEIFFEAHERYLKSYLRMPW